MPLIYLLKLEKLFLLLNIYAWVAINLVELRELLFLVTVDFGQEDVLGQLAHFVQVARHLVVFFDKLLTLSAPRY